jgi:cobyrinic acid a,c-diamide synthase
VEADSTDANPLFKGSVRGHEFHYSELKLHSIPEYGFRMSRGIGISGGMDGICVRNSLGEYMHQNALSAEDWCKTIVEKIE